MNTTPVQLDALAGLCRSHVSNHDANHDANHKENHDENIDVFQSACVHAGRYGTRSSALIRFGEDPRDSEFRFTERPPCTSEYQDYTPLLRALGDSPIR